MVVEALDEGFVVSSKLWITIFKKMGFTCEHAGAEDVASFVRWMRVCGQLEASKENERDIWVYDTGKKSAQFPSRPQPLDFWQQCRAELKVSKK